MSTFAEQGHAAGKARVIPVIVRPCDWLTAPFGKLMAVPTDGKALSMHSNPDEGFLDVVKSIRRAAEQSPPAVRKAPGKRSVDLARQPTLDPRSSNLRVAKKFSDHERATYIDDSFEYIISYFSNSLNELCVRHGELEHTLRRIDANAFTAAVFDHGMKKTGCRVALGATIGDITYSSNDDAREGSFNEWLMVEHDGHAPLLRSGGVASYSNSGSGLTQEGAAELFWAILMGPLQRK